MPNFPVANPVDLIRTTVVAVIVRGYKWATDADHNIAVTLKRQSSRRYDLAEFLNLHFMLHF
jgi:hypothetical protein